MGPRCPPAPEALSPRSPMVPSGQRPEPDGPNKDETLGLAASLQTALSVSGDMQSVQ